MKIGNAMKHSNNAVCESELNMKYTIVMKDAIANKYNVKEATETNISASYQIIDITIPHIDIINNSTDPYHHNMINDGMGQILMQKFKQFYMNQFNRESSGLVE
jgi:hypothetical protein